MFAFLFQQYADVEDEPGQENLEGCLSLPSDLSEAGLAQDDQETEETNSDQGDRESRNGDLSVGETEPHSLMLRLSQGLRSKITRLQIPERNEVIERIKEEAERDAPSESDSDSGYETAEELLTEKDFTHPKENLFNEDQEENAKQIVPKDKIMMRIISHKGMKSYQLGKQLSSKWTTGAGPRIGCMRDYPWELQRRILEQSKLSPRSIVNHRSTQNQTRLGAEDLNGTSHSDLASEQGGIHT